MSNAKARKRETDSKETRRVVLVDDHPLMRQALADSIRDHLPELEIAGEAAGESEALALLRATEPDLMIVDLTLDQGHGIELIKQVRHLLPDLRVLVLSLHDEALYAERAIRAGANGYVTKGSDTATVLEAIRRVLEGKTYLSDRMVENVVGHIAGQPGAAPRDVDELSDRELEVFELMGRGHSTREIAELMNLSMKTVDVYRQRIKAKLGIDTSSELTRRAVCHVMESM